MPNLEQSTNTDRDRTSDAKSSVPTESGLPHDLESTIADPGAIWHSWVQSSPDYVLLLSRNSKVLYINKSLPDLSVEGALGRVMVDCLPSASRAVTKRCLEEVWTSGRSASFVTEHQANRGAIRFYDCRVAPVRRDGEVVALILNAVDVTEEMRSRDALATSLRMFQKTHDVPEEELLRLGLEEGTRITNSEIGFFHFVNPDQNSINLQLWSKGTMKKCSVDEINHHYPIDAAGVWVDCVHQRRPVIHNDYASLAHRRGTPEGHVPVVRELVVPVLEQEKIVAIVGVGNKPDDYTEEDVDRLSFLAENTWTLVQRLRSQTELRRHQDQLELLVRERTEKLRETNARLLDEIQVRQRSEATRLELEEQLLQAQKLEAVGQLAGGIAHDFNNLLQAISMSVELVELELPQDSPVLRDVHEIGKCTEKAASLTRHLLAFSRRQALRPTRLDLNQVVHEIVGLLQRMIGESRIRFEPARDLGPIQADAAQIEQILINLSLNARDASPHGGNLTLATASATLDEQFVASHPWAEVGSYACLTVADDGCGMDEETLRRVFEPFFTTKDVGKGSGLGLSTVYGIVKQHGGLVDVRSAPGEGTSFRLFFPMDRD